MLPVCGDLSWWQIEMLINDRVKRGVKSVSHCYDAVSFVLTETANQQKGEDMKRRKGLKCTFKQMFKQINLFVEKTCAFT